MARRWGKQHEDQGDRSHGAPGATYSYCQKKIGDQADAVVTAMFAPVFDKMVADGKLKSWGWLEHIVGGKYRRLATISADDVKALMEARAAVVDAMEDSPGGEMLTAVCGQHTDYIWELQVQAP